MQRDKSMLTFLASKVKNAFSAPNLIENILLNYFLETFYSKSNNI